MKVSVSVSIFGSAWYQYQYQYRNFRPAEYQYRIGIEFVDKESISIVSVSEKVVSKGSGPNEEPEKNILGYHPRSQRQVLKGNPRVCQEAQPLTLEHLVLKQNDEEK